MGALLLIHGHPDHALAADHRHFGHAAVFTHVLQRDDGVGREISVFHALAGFEQALAGFERNQVEVGEQIEQFFARQARSSSFCWAPARLIVGAAVLAYIACLILLVVR
jgi:hypothetical protein